MATAKAINLSVRPIQSVDLCYPMNGIIEHQPEDLIGRAVQAYDRAQFYDKLAPNADLPSRWDVLNRPPKKEKKVTVGDGKPGKIKGQVGPVGGIFEDAVPRVDGPDGIRQELEAVALSRLRSEDIATDLTQTIGWYRLQYLADQTDEAFDKKIELLGQFPRDPNSISALVGKLDAVLRDRHEQTSRKYSETGYHGVEPPESTSTHHSDTKGAQQFTTDSSTTTRHYSQELQFPAADNTARYLRSEIGLRQEKLAAYRLNSMHTYENLLVERAMSAAEIRKIQLAYIDTFLVPPFNGIVTAVFRNVGDAVTAGQPVLRIENDRTVYLVGTIKCRSLLRLGQTAQVTTTLFDEPGAPPISIQGTVCAVRGHEAVDEQWNVLIRCNNEGADGARLLPLNYSFDFDSTSIEIQTP